MKEAQRWQSRIELSLDNRQIFLLFFASAVVVSLVFALGVVVGRRLDRQPARSTTTDPLALLDQMGQESGEDSLTFHETLGNDKPVPAAQPRSDAGAAPGVTPKAEPARPAPEPPRPAAKPEPKPATGVKALAEKLLPKAPAVVAAAPADAGKKELGKPKKQPREPAAPAEAKGDEDATYTLQLSSFQEKREAELFMKKLREGGLSPYMTPTTIPGRGVWYRVRLGKYKSWDDALTAKQTFEKTQKIIAYVSKT
jgi:DedD protein